MLLVAVLAIWGLLLLSLGFLLLGGDRRCDRPRSSRAAVTVVIPARNESSFLPRLLESLTRQTHRPLEVIVADDGSTDQTADIAAQMGARVVAPGPKPPEFRGKTWPCLRGAQEARGEVLVFLDADTYLEPEGLARLVATLDRGGGLVSAEPHHVTERPYEQLSAYFNLIRAGSVGGFGLLDSRPRAAFGPCVAIGRDEYFTVGGHDHPDVRGQILEHYFLGQAMIREGRRVVCCAGAGTVAMRMYPHGLRELVEGWSKAFMTGAATTGGAFLALTILWISGAMTALILLAVAPLLAGMAGLGLAVVLYLLAALQLRWLLGKVGRFSPWTALLFPIPLFAFFAIFVRSTYLVRVRGQVRWRGSTVAVGPTAEGSSA
jgi:4,4'-diaponeurosporenoate glycosyltransferase